MDIILVVLIILLFLFGFVGALLAITDYFSEFRRFNRILKNFIYYNKLSIPLRNGLGIAEWNKKKCEFSQYIINIILEDFVIIYTHQIRGSLIEVAYKRDLNNIDLDSSYIELPEKSKIIKYVDQSIQYSGMIGLNDITIKIEDNEIKKLRKQLDDFVYLQELANHRSLNEKKTEKQKD